MEHLEAIKLQIESDLNNIEEAECLPETQQTLSFIKRTKKDVNQQVCFIGREVTPRYLKLNSEAFEVGAEWLNEQGLIL